jgi:cysteine desulfurase/selenocysteine lyase
MAAQSPVKITTGIEKFRADFPVLKTKMNGQKLAYLDTAASAQKPRAVIDAMNAVYEGAYANIHRGLYRMSTDLTEKFENVRARVARFIGATEKEIVFARNATEGVNLVAMSWGHRNLRPGDEIILTEMEHHANIVPWQILRDHIGIVIKTVPFDATGTLNLEALEKLLSPKTKLLGLVHISNALGTINPVRQIIKMVRAYNKDIHILVDGSQAVVHGPVNMRELDADFYVFTGHKLYGPTGIGVLYGKYRRAECHAAIPGRRRHDRARELRKNHVQGRAVQIRGGYASNRRGHRPRRRHRLLSAIGMDNIAAHEQDLTGPRDRAVETDRRPHHSWHRAGEGRHPQLHHEKHSPVRYRHGARPMRRRRTRRASLLHAADGEIRTGFHRPCLTWLVHEQR